MDSFDIDIDYVQLVKLCEPDSEGEKRYSPARCTSKAMH